LIERIGQDALPGRLRIVVTKDDENAEQMAERTSDYAKRVLSPIPAAERGYVEAVIMPHATRRSVARALVMLRHKTLERPWKKHGNIPL